MSKYPKMSTLPDLDYAQDVYETLEDDTPTARSPSLASSRSSVSDDDIGSTGISKPRINRDIALGLFQSSRLDVQDVDFSDRLTGGSTKHRSYRVRQGRRERVYGDDSDAADAEESKAQKLARLVREVEELKAEMATVTDASDDQVPRKEEVKAQEQEVSVVDQLSKTLKELQVRSDRPAAVASSSDTPPSQPATGETAQPTMMNTGNSPPQPPSTQTTQAVEEHTTRILSRATALEARLSALETLVGSSTTDSTTPTSFNTDKPMASHLALLEKQITTINTTTPPQLETMSSHIEQLLQSTQRLSSARDVATINLQKLQAQRSMGVPKGVHPALFTSGSLSHINRTAPVTADVQTPQSPPDVLEDPEHLARVDKLYGALPGIESALPMLPAIVERLRTLRFVHADAASARQDLKELQKRQVEVSGELQRWRTGLEKIETVMREGRETDKDNKKEVEAWVKELESRMSLLV